jgi:large subunit ribosomal protein L17
MRHGIKRWKLTCGNRDRDSLLVGLSISMVQSEQIKTTLTKAKALRSFVEKLITLGKRGTLSDRRYIVSILQGNSLASDIAAKLIDDLSVRYKDRQGGYTRLIRSGYRQGDNAEMAIMQFV